MNRRFLIMSIVVCLSTYSYANSEVDSLKEWRNGRKLFQSHCSSCHNIHRQNVGPLLASITKKRSSEWLLRFISDSQKVIASGDPYAVYVYDRFHHQVMPSFRMLSSEEIQQILLYVDRESVRYSNEIDIELEILHNSPSEILKGKQIFQDHCETCHGLYHQKYGPALGSATRRLPPQWLMPFIKDSQLVIERGDPYAVSLFHSFNDHVMVRMEFLGEENIKAVLDYIEYAAASPSTSAGVNGRVKANGAAAASTHMISTKKAGAHNFFQTLFIIVLVAGLSVHAYLIHRIYLYLCHEQVK